MSNTMNPAYVSSKRIQNTVSDTNGSLVGVSSNGLYCLMKIKNILLIFIGETLRFSSFVFLSKRGHFMYKYNIRK